MLLRPPRLTPEWKIDGPIQHTPLPLITLAPVLCTPQQHHTLSITLSITTKQILMHATHTPPLTTMSMSHPTLTILVSILLQLIGLVRQFVQVHGGPHLAERLFNRRPRPLTFHLLTPASPLRLSRRLPSRRSVEGLMLIS
jgi:hypothetical protein